MNRLAQLQQLLSENPDDAFLLFAMAKEQEKLGDSATALQWYQQLRQKHPTYVGLYYHLGKLYEGQEDLETALSVYEAGMAVAREAGDQHALGELAGAKLALED